MLTAFLLTTMAFASSPAEPGACGPGGAPALPRAAAVDKVRTYFDALRRQDRAAIAAVTLGAATDRSNEILDRIQDEARRRNVKVELRLRHLDLAPGGPSGALAVPVVATFDIDIIARRWFFSTVAREVNGTARFLVAGPPDGGPPGRARIAGIDVDFGGETRITSARR